MLKLVVNRSWQATVAVDLLRRSSYSVLLLKLPQCPAPGRCPLSTTIEWLGKLQSLSGCWGGEGSSCGDHLGATDH